RVRVGLIAENAGTCAADDVNVRLSLPDGLRYATGSRVVDGRTVSENDPPGAFVFPRVEAGHRVEAAIDAYVVSPAVDGTPLPITGSLRWATGSRTFERSLTVRSSPRFLETRNTVTLDGPAQVAPGGEVRATLRIANDGTAQATGVRIVIDADTSLQSIRYADDGGEARVQPSGIDVGTLAPGAGRTFTLLGTVASPIPDRAAIRLRARLDNDQTAPVALGQIDLVVRSRPRFTPTTSGLSYPAGDPLRPSAHGDVHIVLLNDGTDVARDVRLQLDVTADARIESVDGATRVGTALLFGDVQPGARVEATVRLRLARLVSRGTVVTVNGRLEAVGLLPLALPPVTIPTIAEPRFDEGASLRLQPSETVDAGEPLFARLNVRNTGDGAASRLAIRAQLPSHTAYLPGSTLVNDVPLLDVDGGSVLWSKSGLVLEDVDPGVEITVRFGTVVNTPLAAGTLIDAQSDLTWDGGGTLTVASAPVRVRSTPAFAVRASGLPFSVSGIAPRTVDVLHDIAEQRRAAAAHFPPPPVALPPAPPTAPQAAQTATPPSAAQSVLPTAQTVPTVAETVSPTTVPSERAAFRYDEDAIEARFRPAPPEPTAPTEPTAETAITAEPAMPDADVAAGAVAALPHEPERVDHVAHAAAEGATVAPAAEEATAVSDSAASPALRQAQGDGGEPVAEAPPEVVSAPEPARPAQRARLVFARDALERALGFLEQSDYGGLVTHLFAIRTLLPTAFVGLNGEVSGKLAAERESLRGVVDRLFIKLRMPRY
ncbi:MAG: hypothetical protein JO103_02775, partial [Candidatus Eremiobacteraeota bacterium]|nr:hypothetical protein [Candidatus Eremiobacteraeota bacterium]